VTAPEDNTRLLRSLADRVAIAEVLHAYCRMVDENDLDLLPTIFADGCRVRFRPGEAHDRRGLDALRDYFVPGGTRVAACSHHVSNIDVSFVDDEIADVRSLFYAWQKYSADGKEGQTWGQYIDRFIRTAAGWRILDRQLLVAGSTSAGDRFPTPRKVTE
jgi:3-phenylpropionate/cinnamic acid dioxygenase small subunit